MKTSSIASQAGIVQLAEQNSVNANWNGSSTTLAVGQNVQMQQTSNGTMVFAYLNMTKQNNAGQLSLTSGGSQPQFLNAPALANQPGIVMQNWQANNLSVTNISANTSISIWIEAFGPGVPGQQNPFPLPIGGTGVPLTTGQAAQGTALPQSMRLILKSNTSDLAVFAVVGGPPDASGNNGYVIAVNAPSDTPPPGYYATTTSNSCSFPFNWGSSLVYVVNLSPTNSSNVNVVLQAL